MEKLRLRKGRSFKVFQPSRWQSWVGTQACPFAPHPYLKHPCPSLEAGPGPREEARGRERQEFKLGERVGGGWEVWEWLAMRAWATGCSVELRWAEGQSGAGIALLSQGCVRGQGLQGRHREGGPALRPVEGSQHGGLGVELGSETLPQDHGDLRRKRSQKGQGGHIFQKKGVVSLHKVRQDKGRWAQPPS